MLVIGPEVVEGPTRSINVSFIEVRGFSRTQSCILRIVHIESCVVSHILRIVRMLPLVNLCTMIFYPII